MKQTLLFVAVLSLTLSSADAQEDVHSQWQQMHDRIFIGADYWANPMENWRIADGRLECTVAARGRSVHLLTRQLGEQKGSFTTSVHLGLVDGGNTQGKRGVAGFSVGVHDSINDYRGNCIHGSGVLATLSSEGVLFVAGQTQTITPAPKLDDVTLTLTGTDDGTDASLHLQAKNGDKVLGEVTTKVDRTRLLGNMALIHNPGAPVRRNQQNNQGPAPNARFWFQNWRVSGDKLIGDDEQAFGPILWAMHTVSDSRSDDGYVMKITGLLPPLGDEDNRQVELHLQRNGEFQKQATVEIDPDAYTATFRVPEWDSGKDVPYRLVYHMSHRDGSTTKHDYAGTIRKQPLDRPLVLGGLTCQHDSGFPYGPVAENLEQMNPDMLFFSGDQLYEGNGGFGIIRDPAEPAIINYLRKFYMHGWVFGDVMRDRPTLCIPDDHDVFQGNIWGEAGEPMKHKDRGASSLGGYREPARMVQVVHRTCTSHHPELFDPTPVKQGISVYYGDMVYGRVSFAILGDRQFKSGPEKARTNFEGRADHVSDESVDVRDLDQPGLELLGERQEKFLEHWVADWRGADMKVLLSETLFGNAATHHGTYDGYLIADLDSGGWPQTPRDRAVKIIRKAFPLHVNGDQHLTTMVQLGVDEQRDSFWSFCTPAISVGYPRWWRPDEVGRTVANRPEGNRPNTGEYKDGFLNLIYVAAVGNPEGDQGDTRYQRAHVKGSGFGIVRIDRDKRNYTCESYRFLDEAGSDLPTQFPGWPMVIQQQDNYGRARFGTLDEVYAEGAKSMVVEVINEADDSLVYALRVDGERFRPFVFEDGDYKVRVTTADGKRFTVGSFRPSATK